MSTPGRRKDAAKSATRVLVSRHLPTASTVDSEGLLRALKQGHGHALKPVKVGHDDIAGTGVGHHCRGHRHQKTTGRHHVQYQFGAVLTALGHKHVAEVQMQKPARHRREKCGDQFSVDRSEVAFPLLLRHQSHLGDQ